MADKMAAKMKKTVKTFSMQNAHLSVDIQLYHIACIVQWSDSLLLDIAGVASRNDAYADVVSWVHRDADEGIESLASSQSSGLMHYVHCHLITTVLLHDFFQSGINMYQELREYKEAV